MPTFTVDTGRSAREQDLNLQPINQFSNVLLLNIPLRETVGAMNVRTGTALRVARRETAATALRALCDSTHN